MMQRTPHMHAGRMIHMGINEKITSQPYNIM